MKQINKRSKSSNKHNPSTILSLGHYDIDYSITLIEEDVLKYNIDDISKLTKYEDILFIIENQYMWSRIQIETESTSVNLLLYINKVSFESNKSYIEYIPYEQPVYYNEKIENMFKNVNELNYFFVNNSYLNPKCKKFFKLTIKYLDKETVIKFDNVESYNSNVDNEVLGEGGSSSKGNENEEGNDEGNSANPFDNVKLQCSKYDYFICSISEMLENNNYEYFIDFVINIKLKYEALITIEYTDISNYFNDKDSMSLLNKVYLITDIFLLDEQDTINNFKKHFEILVKENTKKKYFFNREPSDLQESNELQSSEESKNQYMQENTYKKPYKNNREKNITERDLHEYFRKTIACEGGLSILNSKLGIFLDYDFTEITFIEVPMRTKSFIISYPCKPYPKLSHRTVDLVDLYKQNILAKRNLYKSILYGGILSRIFFEKRKNFGLEILYPSYLTGHEIIKRLLDLQVNNITFPPDPKFYVVKLNPNEINEYVKKETLGRKESKFVLDCTNLEKSKLKHYVPLFDYNLHEYFENKSIQRELAKKGFINSKGFVNYDPYYRGGMGVPKKKVVRFVSADNNLVKKQVEVNMKNLNNRILLNPIIPTKKKLPVLQCKVTEKIKNYNKNYSKNCSHGYNNNKCQYCDLYERAKIEIDIEEEKRKRMQLRRYK